MVRAAEAKGYFYLQGLALLDQAGKHGHLQRRSACRCWEVPLDADNRLYVVSAPACRRRYRCSACRSSSQLSWDMVRRLSIPHDVSPPLVT